MEYFSATMTFPECPRVAWSVRVVRAFLSVATWNGGPCLPTSPASSVLWATLCASTSCSRALFNHSENIANKHLAPFIPIYSLRHQSHTFLLAPSEQRQKMMQSPVVSLSLSWSLVSRLVVASRKKVSRNLSIWLVGQPVTPITCRTIYIPASAVQLSSSWG